MLDFAWCDCHIRRVLLAVIASYWDSVDVWCCEWAASCPVAQWKVAAAFLFGWYIGWYTVQRCTESSAVFGTIWLSTSLRRRPSMAKQLPNTRAHTQSHTYVHPMSIDRNQCSVAIRFSDSVWLYQAVKLLSHPLPEDHRTFFLWSAILFHIRLLGPSPVALLWPDGSTKGFHYKLNNGQIWIDNDRYTIYIDGNGIGLAASPLTSPLRHPACLDTVPSKAANSASCESGQRQIEDMPMGDVAWRWDQLHGAIFGRLATPRWSNMIKQTHKNWWSENITVIQSLSDNNRDNHDNHDNHDTSKTFQLETAQDGPFQEFPFWGTRA